MMNVNIEKLEGLDNKEMAKEIRKELRLQFKGIKFSVTSSLYGINVNCSDEEFEMNKESITDVVGMFAHYVKYSSDTIYFNNRIASYGDTKEYKEKQRKEKEQQELAWSKQREEQEKLYNDNVQIESIDNKNIKVINVEDKEVFVMALEPSINKNNWKITNDEYIIEESHLNKYKITDIVIMNEAEYNYFSFNLLNDYDFLTEKGGTCLNDVTGKVLYNYAVCICCKGKESIIVDPQGYSYARYTNKLVQDINKSLQTVIDEEINEVAVTEAKTIENNTFVGIEEDQEKLPDANDFNNIDTLQHKYITNWNLIPEELQKFITSCDSYYINLQGIDLYKGNKMVASCGVSRWEDKIEMQSMGSYELFQWNIDDGFSVNTLVQSTKKAMTHNEYIEYLKVNASKIYNTTEYKDYSYKQYSEDCDSVYILPFELSLYNLPKEIETILNNTFTENTIGSKNEYMLKGFSQDEEEWYTLTNKLNLKRVMSYNYSGYCYNENLNMYMTYCEGDLYLHLFKNKENYTQSLNETIEYYENEE